MSMAITCPNCGFSKEVPEDRVPAGVRWARCPQCNNRFALPARPPVATIEEGHTASRGPCAWENRGQLGSLTAIYETMKGVLFSPADFFGEMTFQAGARDPLLFGILLGSGGKMVGFFWDFVLMWGGFRSFGAGIDRFTMGIIFILLMVFSPLLVTVTILFTSGILHLLLLMTDAGKHRFEATMRVVSYGQATQIWGVIPLMGGIVGGLWFLVAQVIGLREIHEAAYWRIIVAFLIPFFLILVLMVSAVFFLFVMT